MGSVDDAVNTKKLISSLPIVGDFARRAHHYLVEKHGLALFRSQEFLRRACGKTSTTEVNLEFVNYCNLRCKWCSVDHAQKKYVMSKELLHKFFDNFLQDSRFHGIKEINLFNGGETLLHPEFIDMLKAIKDYKCRFIEKGLRFPILSLLTNGMLLNAELSQKIAEVDVLDLVRFSVDGGSRERCEELRGGVKWATVAKNIEDFIKVSNRKCRTGIICVIDYDKPKTIDWMTDEFKALCGLVDHVELRYPHDWMGDVKVAGLKKKFQNHCHFLIHSLVVLPNGNVAVCCGDLNGKKGAVGNLLEQDLFQIYNSPLRATIIRKLLSGKRDQIDLCKNCSGY